MTSKKEIRFWGKNGVYFEFTNFYIRPVKIDDNIWLSTEHYYQINKFTDPEIIKEMKNVRLPKDIYNLANVKYKSKIRKDWSQVRLDIMRKAIYEKFNQNSDLKKLLLSTNNAILIENSPYDSFWGVGGFGNKYIDGTNNWLGKILMETRAKFT